MRRVGVTLAIAALCSTHVAVAHTITNTQTSAQCQGLIVSLGTAPNALLPLSDPNFAAAAGFLGSSAALYNNPNGQVIQPLFWMNGPADHNCGYTQIQCLNFKTNTPSAPC